MKIIYVTEELSGYPKGSFLNLVEFNQATIGACDISGTSPEWEMHPDTDEFFYIIEGQFEIMLLDSGQGTLYIARAGSCFVVPKGIWHKPAASQGCKFIHITPGDSLHSSASDPRI